MSVLKKISTIAVIILIIIAVFFIMILWNGKYTAPVSTGVEAADKIREAQKEGGMVSFDEKECNELINIYFRKYFGRGTLSVKGMYAFLDGNSIILKAPVKYKNISMVLTAKGTVSYADDSLNFTPQYFKAGMLRIPESIAFKAMKKYVKAIAISGESISIPESSMPFLISDAEIKGGKLVMAIDKYTAKGLFDDKIAALKKAEQELINMQSKASNQTEKKKIQSAVEEIRNAVKNPDKVNSNTIKDVDSKINDIIQSSENSKNKQQAQGLKDNLENSGEEKKKQALSKLGSELNSAMASLKTSEEKQIIGLMQSTINKMIQNTSYNYNGDATNVRNKYSKLSEASRKEVKSAILYNVDSGVIMDLRKVFGI